MKKILLTVAAIIALTVSLPAVAEKLSTHPPPPSNLPFETMGLDELASYHLPPDTASHPALLRLLKSGNLHEPAKLPVRLSTVKMRPFKKSNLPAENTTYIRSSNWSGFIALPYPGGGPGTIEGIFAIPPFNRFDGTSVSMWVGLDGFTSNDVLQAGVVCIPDPYGCVAFAEYFPDFPYALFDASSGDWIISQAWHVGGPGRPQAHAIVVDGTSGDYVSFDFSCIYSCSSDPWTGTSAEWIVEAPGTGTGSIYPLSPYGTISFSNSYTYHPVSGNLGLYPGQPNNSYNVTMHDAAGNNISLCQDIDFENFYCYRPPPGFSPP